ncbi:hypothetical protein SEA_GRAVAILLIA_23 [Mycobacterium phage Gravaillia]|uniref:Minor tail protein n=1 Tax=Mycobacterium phage Gancho TaxID=2301613 RepID=A0A385UEP3_9CAUD|nr:minor tail protein [Mycobacterium phage Gancho]WAB10133.1 hypothetical protein SEA_GRAVAILLIA_23 [Mycobacterium phage Gravaillia]
MGKASRNRAQRGGTGFGDAGRPSGAATVFPNFPYERKFTREEIQGDILPRAKRMGDLMRDGMGPNGATLFIPGDVFEMWMIHGVLAGADGGKPYIRARKLPDESGRFVDAVEWVVIKDDTPEQRRADAEAEAQMYVDALEQNLRPEVRAAIRRKFKAAAEEAAEFLGDDDDADARRDVGRDFGPPRLLQFTDDADNPEEGSE